MIAAHSKGRIQPAFHPQPELAGRCSYLTKRIQEPFDRPVDILHQPLYHFTPSLVDRIIVNACQPEPDLLRRQCLQPSVRIHIETRIPNVVGITVVVVRIVVIIVRAREPDVGVRIRQRGPVGEICDFVHDPTRDLTEVFVLPIGVPMIGFVDEDFEVDGWVLGVGEDEGGDDL